MFHPITLRKIPWKPQIKQWNWNCVTLPETPLNNSLNQRHSEDAAVKKARAQRHTGSMQIIILPIPSNILWHYGRLQCIKLRLVSCQVFRVMNRHHRTLLYLQLAAVHLCRAVHGPADPDTAAADGNASHTTANGRECPNNILTGQRSCFTQR